MINSILRLIYIILRPNKLEAKNRFRRAKHYQGLCVSPLISNYLRVLWRQEQLLNLYYFRNGMILQMRNLYRWFPEYSPSFRAFSFFWPAFSFLSQFERKSHLKHEFTFNPSLHRILRAAFKNKKTVYK